MSGSIEKNFSLDEISWKINSIFEVEALPENCLDEKVMYDNKELTVHVCTYTVNSTIQIKEGPQPKKGSTIRIISSKYLSALNPRPSGKWAFSPASKHIIAPGSANGTYLVLAHHKDEKLNAFVGSLDFGIIDLKLKSRVIKLMKTNPSEVVQPK